MKLIPILLSASLVLAAPAAAQMAPPRPERPYRGLFGGGTGNIEQLLSMNVSVGAGYDTNVLAGDATGVTGQTGPNSAFSSLLGDLSYSLNRKRVGINASVAASARYHPSVEFSQLVSAQSGSVGAFAELSKSTHLTLSHTTTHQPYLTLGLFPPLFDIPGEAVPPPPEYGIASTDYLSHNSWIGLTQSLGRRTSLSLNYGYRLDDFDGDERDLSGPIAGARVSVQMKKNLGVYGGYNYSGATYGSSHTGGNYTGKSIDAGIDFNRPFSITRRTTFTFATGSSALSDETRTVYGITGHAALNHEIGRSWNASLAYRREASFVEMFSEPVFADSLTIGVAGLLSRKLQFQASAAASFGEFALSSQGSGFTSYTGYAGLTYGLTRYLGISTSYSYYHYSFEETAPLPPEFLRRPTATACRRISVCGCP